MKRICCLNCCWEDETCLSEDRISFGVALPMRSKSGNRWVESVASELFSVMLVCELTDSKHVVHVDLYKKTLQSKLETGFLLLWSSWKWSLTKWIFFFFLQNTGLANKDCLMIFQGRHLIGPMLHRLEHLSFARAFKHCRFKYSCVTRCERTLFHTRAMCEVLCAQHIWSMRTRTTPKNC